MLNIYCNVVVVVSVLITMYLRRLTVTYPYHRGPTLFIYSKYVVLCLLYDIPPWMTHYGVRVSQHVLNCHFHKLLSEEEAIPKGVSSSKEKVLLVKQSFSLTNQSLEKGSNLKMVKLDPLEVHSFTLVDQVRRHV